METLLLPFVLSIVLFAIIHIILLALNILACYLTVHVKKKIHLLCSVSTDV